MSGQQIRTDWLVAGSGIAVLMLLVLVLYQQTLVYLTGFWNELETGAYAHGYLVLMICGYLIIRSRRALSEIKPCPDFRMLLAVGLSSLLWLVAALVDVQVIEAVALLALLFSLVWAVLGKAAARILMFPVLFIIFAIPIWFPLTTILQDLTADVVFEVVRLLRIPAFRQENMIMLPAGTLSVEEACSGMRYFLAAITLGALYGYLNYRTFISRSIVFVVAAATGILVNIIRVFIVVYLGYATDMQHPVIHDHFMLGWYLFGGLVVILLFIDARIYRHRELSGASVGEAVDSGSQSLRNACASGRAGLVLIIVAASLLLSAGPATVFSINSQSRTIQEDVRIEMPPASREWTGQREHDDNWTPVYHGAINQKWSYSSGTARVLVYVGYYLSQRQGEELITFHNRISDEEAWKTSFTRSRHREVESGDVLEQILEDRSGARRLVWYWYNVAHQKTVNKYEAKALQVLGMLTGEPQAYVVAVAVDMGEDEDDASAVLQAFLTNMAEPLNNISVTIE